MRRDETWVQIRRIQFNVHACTQPLQPAQSQQSCVIQTPICGLGEVEISSWHLSKHVDAGGGEGGRGPTQPLQPAQSGAAQIPLMSLEVAIVRWHQSGHGADGGEGGADGGGEGEAEGGGESGGEGNCSKHSYA